MIFMSAWLHALLLCLINLSWLDCIRHVVDTWSEHGMYDPRHSNGVVTLHTADIRLFMNPLLDKPFDSLQQHARKIIAVTDTHKAAARLITRPNREHITPVLKSLHGLPGHLKVDFKILMITFKSRRGLAPQCPPNIWPPEPLHTCSNLRSASRSFLSQTFN